MPKRKCTFNEKLQNEYTFLKKCQKPGQEYKIECTVCGAAFSIEHGGKSDITQHLKSERHNIAARASKSQKVSNFFSPKTQFADKEQKLAADEEIFAYHTCKHSQSLNSMDCTSQLVRKLYEKKFTCGSSKEICTSVGLPISVTTEFLNVFGLSDNVELKTLGIASSFSKI
ncbi:hypothetical protein QTP88_005498 [Uroleucon formosanum]